MVRSPHTKDWIVPMLRGERVERLGTITVLDADAAVAEAIREFRITDPECQRRVIVRPIASVKQPTVGNTKT